MKKTLSNIIRLVIFLSITFFLIIILGKAFTPTGWKDDHQGQIYSIKGIDEIENNSIDVLLLGASSFQKGISPLEIYENTGITSYNYAISSARVYMFYYFLQDILQTQKPKVVMADIVTLFYKSREEEPEQRKSFDYNNLDLVKLKMISDDVFDTTFEEKVSYVFPLLRYHSRWDELTISEVKDSFAKYPSIFKGYLMSAKWKPNNNGWDYMKPTNRKVQMQDYVSEYFYKLVDLCKKNNIELILVGMPDTRAWNYASSKEVERLAKENDIKFLDLNDKDKYPLDWLKDTEDGGYHMNILGAQKLTKYVSDYLKDNYDLPDHRKDQKYLSWTKELEDYHKYSEESINIVKRKIKNNTPNNKK